MLNSPLKTIYIGLVFLSTDFDECYALGITTYKQNLVWITDFSRLQFQSFVSEEEKRKAGCVVMGPCGENYLWTSWKVEACHKERFVVCQKPYESKKKILSKFIAEKQSATKNV